MPTALGASRAHVATCRKHSLPPLQAPPAQELRELAVRGVDGPGMHILDVLPRAYPTAPGALQLGGQQRGSRLAEQRPQWRSQACKWAWRLLLATLNCTLCCCFPAAGIGAAVAERRALRERMLAEPPQVGGGGWVVP